MNTAAPAFRCPSCGQENDPRLTLPAVSTTDLPVLVRHDTSAVLPDGLLADLVGLNGGQQVTMSLARLVWMLVDLLIDAQERLDDVADVLEEHGHHDQLYLSDAADRPLLDAVQTAMDATEECRAVLDVLTNAGFGTCGQSLLDAVDEMVFLATEGEVAYALLLEAGYVTESHRVRDGLQEALAAAARA
jgi:hypothetical protein